MNSFLLLILVELSSGAYETRLSVPFASMAACQKYADELVIPKQKGISYYLECITMKDTMEAPA